MVITCAFAWKARCSVIMFTSSVVRSTLEFSSELACTLPKPADPAVPCTDVPEEKVWAQFVSLELLETLRVREIRDRELPKLRGAAVGVDRRDDSRRVDGDRAELARRIAVLGDRVHAELRFRTSVDWPKLKVMFIVAAPSVGVKPAKASCAVGGGRDLAGAGVLKRLRAADLGAVDRHVHVPQPRGGGLTEIERRRIGVAEGVVDGRRGRLAVGGRIRRIERRGGRHRVVRRQVEDHVPAEVGTGALCEVFRLRLDSAPVLNPPLASGG